MYRLTAQFHKLIDVGLNTIEREIDERNKSADKQLVSFFVRFVP
jgi:hypothetical protein